MNLTLHIGLPKTGTTIIQSHLDANFREAADGGVIYPKSCQDHTAAHTRLACYFFVRYIERFGNWGKDGLLDVFADPVTALQLHDLSLLQIFQQPLNQENFFARDGIKSRAERGFFQLIDEVKLRGDGRVFLSSEHLGSLATDERFVKIIHDETRGLFNCVQIVIYFRDPLMLACASFAQSIKMAYRTEFYLPKCRDIMFISFEQLDRLWSSYFKLVPRLYIERYMSATFDVVDDFFTACGLDRRISVSKRENRSWSWSQVQLAKIIIMLLRKKNIELRNEGEMRAEYEHFVSNSGLGSARYLPDIDLCNRYFEAYAPEYEYLAERFSVEVLVETEAAVRAEARLVALEREPISLELINEKASNFVENLIRIRWGSAPR